MTDMFPMTSGSLPLPLMGRGWGGAISPPTQRCSPNRTPTQPSPIEGEGYSEGED